MKGSERLQNKLVNGKEFAEQRETFKRIANVKKGGTDHAKPDTFK